MATEIELKLQIIGGPEGLMISKIKECLSGLKIDPQLKVSRLTNTYFDTSLCQLSELKMALRIREMAMQNETLFIQTFKTKGCSVQGLSQRGEWEWPVLSLSIDASRLLACEAWPKEVDLNELHALFETNFIRHQCEFDFQDSRIELALDQGEIKSKDQIEPINEIELELKQGQEGDLISLAGHLKKAIALAPSDISKAERGYRLHA